MVDPFDSIKTEKRLYFMLYELLSQGLVRLNVEATDREDAIRKVGAMMVEKGFVEPAYVDGMCQVAAEMPGYIVITNGVAMPHSRPELGVHKVCAALMTLKDPVPFGHVENDPVKLLIAIAAVDNNAHVDLIQNIATVFDCEDVVEKLKKSTSVEEVLELIKDRIEGEEQDV
jgi:mannitol/fructose-specific phosphotransferase system IIA component (Ntr-type)